MTSLNEYPFMRNYKFRNHEITVREKILANMNADGETPWRNADEWHAISGLGWNLYADAIVRIIRFDATLTQENDNTVTPQVHRWKLRPTQPAQSTEA